MGCHTITVKDLGKVFIPGCMGAAVYGIDRCTCYSYRKRKLSPDELIKVLKDENKQLKARLSKYEKS